jgi:hypothetical protein
MNTPQLRGVAAVLFTALAIAGCDNTVSVPDTGMVQVLLTDAPSDYISEAFIDIGAVELLPSGDGERIVLSEDGTDGPINLLDLQGLTTEVLADLEVPSGTYHELRLFIESASVTLADGYEFKAGGSEGALRVPSGASSGLKLKLRSGEEDQGSEDGEGEDGEGDESGGVEIAGGETILLVDFDVNRSFRIQGNPDTPAGINGVSFRPTLRVVVSDIAGSIGGTVRTDLPDASRDGLVVMAETVNPDPGDTEFQTQTATALTDAEGEYTLYFLAPGTYVVTVETPDGLTTTPGSVEVIVEASGDVRGVDFEIIAG